jgi:uncharacterized phage protein gp47/JayE
MYKNMTYEFIIQRMLSRVLSSIDRREGSVIFDALAPAAAELAQMYIEADVILNETFADTASRDYLVKRAVERGITPNQATNAILKGIFNINVPISSRFSLGKLNYVVIEKDKDFEFKLKCESKGTEGNLLFGTLIPIDYIDGLESAMLTEVIIPGEDEEDTEELRTRYFSTLDLKAFGGNVTDYKEKVNGLQGVGGLKVYPTWNGGGTVKLVIINSEYKKPSDELVEYIQTEVDPVGKQGNGIGIAPIGHTVTVLGVGQQEINITTKITYQTGWEWIDVKGYAEEAIDKYFLELCQLWSESECIIVRISQLETRLLNVAGVVDISGTTINGVEQNIVLDKDSIPVRGEIIG